MKRVSLLLPLFLALLMLNGCDSTDSIPDFVPGEVLVTLKPGVRVADFTVYVDRQPNLEVKTSIDTIVVLGVPTGKEEATAARLTRDAAEYVLAAQPNYRVYLARGGS